MKDVDNEEAMGEWVEVEESGEDVPVLIPSYEDGGDGWGLGV